MPHSRCTKCNSENIYSDGALWVCPECAHEWTAVAESVEVELVKAPGVRDAYGTPLITGDSVTVIKELKIKGSSSVIKVGTKVKNIRVTDAAGDGHDISCKIEGIGAINLKSEFVKKA